MSIAAIKQQRRFMAACALLAFFVAYRFWFDSPITLGIDPNAESCLPDVHVALLVRDKPESIQKGDLLFWKPAGPLAHLDRTYVLKRVAGIPGDRLEVQDGIVRINGHQVVSGLALINPEKVTVKDFDRTETSPDGHVFMIGTHPLSNDSRYWGYLPVAQVVGKGYKLL